MSNGFACICNSELLGVITMISIISICDSELLVVSILELPLVINIISITHIITICNLQQLLVINISNSELPVPVVINIISISSSELLVVITIVITMVITVSNSKLPALITSKQVSDLRSPMSNLSVTKISTGGWKLTTSVHKPIP
ncbi:hypothetical protein BT96DRAFT_947993 [Gymnopus androsaceus JB14]|uniref:Uncharacterized protein n=1 Tax=Gymnopus androsaceus JB14 TaxID=1447944 RepID=A0A6A4GQA1_9AGAR|nr:hypothetical protein BT96DRAFT_947993 [Gymnopus androsaceus JB14]